MKADLSHLQDLISLETACFLDPWSERVLRDGLADEKYLILILKGEKGRSLGYLVGWHIGDEAELARIGVMPDHRGQGLSRGLLDEALQQWRTAGVKQVFLEVRESNEAALRLYRSRRFELVSKRSRYYDDGEDALILRREIE